MGENERIIELDDIDIKLELGGYTANILYLRFAPPSRIRNIGNHCHSGYELHFIPFGRGRLVAQGKRYAIEKDIFYLTGPGVYHEQTGDPEDPMAEYCLNFELIPTRSPLSGRKGAYVDEDARRIGETIQGLSFRIGGDCRESIGLFEKVLEEINGKSIAYYSIIRNHLFAIIADVARRCAADGRSSVLPPEKHARDRRRFIADLYVQDAWNTRNVRDCARRLGVGVRQTDRIFKEYYGMSFVEKLLSVRMDNARKILAETDSPIKVVAETVGYEDFGHFCRVFKKKVGMSPSGYRKASLTPE